MGIAQKALCPYFEEHSKSGNALQCFQTVPANQFPFIIGDLIAVPAKNATGRIFLQNDLVIFYEDFQRILCADLKSLPQFLRQNHSAQRINRADNTGRLHDVKPAFSEIQAETVLFRHSPTHTYKIAHISRLVKRKKRQKLQNFYIFTNLSYFSL